MSQTRDFVVYLSTGELLTVSAASLRTAVRQAERELRKEVEIVAALASDCLPAHPAHRLPFHAVLLKNPAFVTPPET